MTTVVRGRLTLVDPTTQPIIADFTGAPRLRDLTDKKVGIIDDSKVNARELLHTVTELLDERFGSRERQVPPQAFRVQARRPRRHQRDWPRSATTCSSVSAIEGPAARAVCTTGST